MTSRRDREARVPKCIKCGERRARHFVPPCFGDRGFYICETTTTDQEATE